MDHLWSRRGSKEGQRVWGQRGDITLEVTTTGELDLWANISSEVKKSEHGDLLFLTCVPQLCFNYNL